MMNPLCEDCLQNGKTTSAEHVHHIISFMTVDDELKRMELALDWDNLRSLCQECHNKEHNIKGIRNKKNE